MTDVIVTSYDENNRENKEINQIFLMLLNKKIEDRQY